MGRKTSAGLLDQRGSGHTCSRCGMEQKDGNSCCRDEYKVFKSNPDQSVAPALILAFTGLVAEMPPAREFPAGDSRPLLSAIKLPPAHGPPLPPGCPVYLRVRNLRI